MFTINNPPEGVGPHAWVDHVDYCVWQKEVGENGTPHLQGYCILKKYKDLPWLKKFLSATAHWERRRGKHSEAKAYCTKEDTRKEGPFEYGTEPEGDGQGARTDISALKRALDEGQTEAEIADNPETFGFWLRYQRSITRYRMLMRANERTWHTHCLVLWGPPGVGKSRRALEEAGEGAYWLRKPSAGGQVWFDGYDGQEVVVIDEFYGWIARDLMQRLCDRYPCLVDTKGGATAFLAKRIIITSNEHPSRWWPKVGLGAMVRRLTGDCGRVEHMDYPRQNEVSALVPGYDADKRYWDEFIDVVARGPMLDDHQSAPHPQEVVRNNTQRAASSSAAAAKAKPSLDTTGLTLRRDSQGSDVWMYESGEEEEGCECVYCEDD